MLKLIKKIKEQQHIKWLEKVEYDWQLVDDSIEFFNEFYGFDKNPITRKSALLLAGYHKNNCHLSLILDALFWKVLNPKTPEQINNFYKITPFEFLSNLFKNMSNSSTKFYPIVKKIMKDLNGKTILDYGGGSGWFALWMYKQGWDVTFAEVSLVSLAWMKWLCKRRKYNIKIIDLNQSKEIGHYDVIFFKDVIEHIEGGMSLLSKLIKHCRHIILSPDSCKGPIDREPMHFRVDFERG